MVFAKNVKKWRKIKTKKYVCKVCGYVVGVAKDAPEDIIKDLRTNFEGLLKRYFG